MRASAAPRSLVNLSDSTTRPEAPILMQPPSPDLANQIRTPTVPTRTPERRQSTSDSHGHCVGEGMGRDSGGIGPEWGYGSVI